jgi:hypothetical protein
MSYTHTLSIQGVHATLQMNVLHSSVQYTLTLHSDSGEEVIAHGRLPNDVMDHFTVINQYVANPEDKKTSEQSVQTCIEQSVKDHIITDLFDFMNKGQQSIIQENQLHHSQSDMAVPNHAECLDDILSPILPSTPRNVEETSIAETCIVEMQQEHTAVPTHQEWLNTEHIQPHDYKKVDLFFDMVVKLYPNTSFLTVRKYYLLYQAWRQQGTHPNLNRWKAMEFWLRTMRPANE